jgi:hypothetical protein
MKTTVKKRREGVEGAGRGVVGGAARVVVVAE